MCNMPPHFLRLYLPTSHYLPQPPRFMPYLSALFRALVPVAAGSTRREGERMG